MSVNGLVVMTPTSIVSTGTGNSSSINANGSVTFSACETLSLNGVFTSSYDNYMVVFRGVNSSSTFNVQARLRSSGTDATAADYVYQSLVANNTIVSSTRNTSSVFSLGRLSTNTYENGFTAFLFGPYLTQPTACRATNVGGLSGARIDDYASTHSLSSSYDGITLISESANITGLVTVFGFNQ